MKEFLLKIKLIDHLTTTLQISRTGFIDKLSSITNEGSSWVFSEVFDVFSGSKQEFKGQVNFEGFKIKKRRRFFDMNMNMAIAKGTFKENSGQLTIETEINGFNNLFIIYYISLTILYCVFIVSLIIPGNDGTLVAIPFLLLHAAFMFLIPYFLMRRGVKRLKYELEREFFYLTKSNQ